MTSECMQEIKMGQLMRASMYFYRQEIASRLLENPRQIATIIRRSALVLLNRHFRLKWTVPPQNFCTAEYGNDSPATEALEWG